MKKLYITPSITTEDLDTTPLMAASDPDAQFGQGEGISEDQGAPSVIEGVVGGDETDAKGNSGGLWD